MKKSIDVIVPAFNEEDCLDELATRLVNVFDSMSGYQFRVILVDNGSSDSTLEIARRLHLHDDRFDFVSLSRNFQTDGGITAGLSRATGDAAILMSADLQDPPELIPEFIQKWESGYDNVYMIVTKRTGVPLLRRFNSQAFYWLASKLTEVQFPRNASDFRLVDRKVYETVRSMPEQSRFIRGMFAWVGFRSTGVHAERPKRHGGTSKAFSMRVFNLGLRGILANSHRPLRLISILGVFLSVLSIVSIAILTMLWMVRGVPFNGFGTLVSLQLLMFGILFLLLGIISEYVNLIYEESKRRPHFIVADSSIETPKSVDPK